MKVTHSELFSQELMGDLLFLVGCPAAEVRKQLLPVCFIFALDNINDILLSHRRTQFTFHWRIVKARDICVV